ncbi:MAG: NAD(P)-dependent alcohol dehydrogenase [Armatimonadota bacterium]|nr:NAD(P)-dependent alcohol dehydrogenase [bacterium]
MKVLRLHKPLDFRFHDEPVPEYGSDEVLVKIGSTGVCASDVHYYRHGKIGEQVPKEPHILGHESSGVVAAVGADVKTLKVGDRVALEPSKSCGHCEMCKQGYINICPNVQFFGTPPFQGTLREYIAWRADLCIPIPDNMTLDEAAIVEPLAVGMYAVQLAEMKGGESVTILGSGAIGLSVLQAAKLEGASKLIVVDPVPERRAIAKKLGADIVLDSAGSTQHIIDETGGTDLVFECAGSPDAVRQTAYVLRPKGKIMIIGIPDEDSYCFDASVSRRRELTVQFVRRSRNLVEKCIELISEGKIDAASMATHVFSFDETEDAFKLAMEKRDGVVRAMIHM